MTGLQQPDRNERGAAVIVALLVMVLLATIGAALVTLTTTESLIAASHRHGAEAASGAEAALDAWMNGSR